MRYLNQYPGFIELENGLQIHDYQVQDYYLRHKVSISLKDAQLLMSVDKEMKLILEAFPYYEVEQRISGMGDGILYVNVNNIGKRVILLSEVMEWVDGHRKDEVKKEIRKQYEEKNNFNYSYTDALTYVASFYFYDELTTYLIWTV